MKSDREARRGIDTSVAHSARIYDWWLGGKDNFAPDRELGQKIVDLVPMTPASARANRAFLHRAAGMVAGTGVHQFLDLGAGLPTVENTHSVVQRIDPTNRVIYIDYDPLVIVHARALLAGNGPTSVVQADIRDPQAILTHPEVTEVIDFTKPVCVLAVAVLHFLTDKEDPHAIVARLREAMAPGSYLVLSHITGDGTSEADEVIAMMRQRMADPPTLRSHAEVLRFFNGFELLDPGVVPVHLWRPDGHDPHQPHWRKPGDEGGPFWMYAGVGHKPDRDDPKDSRRALDDIYPPDAATDVSYATVLRLVRTHCHPDVEAAKYPLLVQRACRPDPQMHRFKAELRGLLGGGVHKLPEVALDAAAGYPEDDDEWFLWRLWQDCFGDEPV